MDERDIIRVMLSHDLNLTPDALDILKGFSEDQLNEILERISEKFPDAAVITREMIEPERAEKFEEMLSIEFQASASAVEGTLDEFLRYMRDRFSRIQGIILSRTGLKAVEIAAAKRMSQGESVTIVGMVREKKKTKQGGEMMLIEDISGEIPCFLQNGAIKERYDRVVKDSVIAVNGTITKNGGINVRNIIFPDIPQRERKPVRMEGKIAFISDIHIGSKYFNRKAFSSFIEWASNEDNLKYIILCGDLIDGVGVYPGQEAELEASNVWEQYKMASEFLSRIPKRIKVIYIPGNHEPVRQSEPQPPVPDKYSEFLPENLMKLSNPSTIGVGGIRITLYHGRSLNAMFKYVPGMQPVNSSSVVRAMETLLMLRHLAPIYGEHPIAPGSRDELVIEEVPDVLCMGHIHVYGIGEYKGVKLINPGTFQEETPYIRKMGIEVTPGTVPVLDLGTMNVSLERF